MDIFEIERAVLRFKEMANVKTDKDVAGLLALDVSAFNKRKKRNSFPERELLALADKRPDLRLDVPYILTGIPTNVRSAMHQTAIERQQQHDVQAHLLDDWQACTEDDQKLLCELAARLKTAKRPRDTGPVLPAPEQTPEGSEFKYAFAQPVRKTRMQTINAPVHGDVAGGNIKKK
jgi:hypothetical protein